MGLHGRSPPIAVLKLGTAAVLCAACVGVYITASRRFGMDPLTVQTCARVGIPALLCALVFLDAVLTLRGGGKGTTQQQSWRRSMAAVGSLFVGIAGDFLTDLSFKKPTWLVLNAATLIAAYVPLFIVMHVRQSWRRESLAFVLAAGVAFLIDLLPHVFHTSSRAAITVGTLVVCLTLHSAWTAASRDCAAAARRLRRLKRRESRRGALQRKEGPRGAAAAMAATPLPSAEQAVLAVASSAMTLVGVAVLAAGDVKSVWSHEQLWDRQLPVQLLVATAVGRCFVAWGALARPGREPIVQLEAGKRVVGTLSRGAAAAQTGAGGRAGAGAGTDMSAGHHSLGPATRHRPAGARRGVTSGAGLQTTYA